MNFALLLLIFAVGISTFVKTEINIEDIRQQILLEHNKYRKIHGVPNLELNSELNFAAQKWADSLAFMDDSLIRHPNKKYSQNLWMVEKIHLDNLMQDDLNPVKDWYNERIYYSGHFDNATFPKYGHFSQIIWKDTEQIGVGIAESVKGNVYVVCNYYPKGNVIENFKNNVLPVLKEYQNDTLIFSADSIESAGEIVSLNVGILILCTVSVLLR